MLGWLGVVSVSSSGLVQAQPAQETDDQAARVIEPFEYLIDVPGGVDAAIVMNDPAAHLLLSDSGRTVRRLLSMSGIISHTEQAWEGFAKALGAGTDETIKSLLGSRVVVMWDEIDFSSGSVLGLAEAIDTHWVILCEVERGYLDEIRAHLKPIRRDISYGHTVYAIEMGRYEIVLLNTTYGGHGGERSRVLLAPRDGRGLLEEVLEQIELNQSAADTLRATGQEKRVVLGEGSILVGKEELVASAQQDASGWQAAWALNLDGFVNAQKSEAASELGSDSQESSALVGLVIGNVEGMVTRFASDLDLGLAQQRAPVGLLSAVGDDAILAIAMGQTPSLFVDTDIVEFVYSLQQVDQAPAGSQEQALPSGREYVGGPGLVLVSRVVSEEGDSGRGEESGDDVEPIVLTVMTGLEADSIGDRSVAEHVDGLMHGLFSAIEPMSAPDHQGRFPDAIRTHVLDRDGLGSSRGQTDQSDSVSWPGEYARFSWIASDLPGMPSVITVLGSEHTDTAKQARWIAQAASDLCSISDEDAPTGVISSGYFWPGKAAGLLESGSPIDLVISGLFERVEWVVRQSPIGIEGTLEIRMTDSGHQSLLGNIEKK